ncbi:hypothetical protein Hanom_Chr03g00249751 [Helianthus anomalus]
MLYVYYIKIPWYICYFTCIFIENLISSFFIAIFSCYLYLKKMSLSSLQP